MKADLPMQLAAIGAIIRRGKSAAGALLPILHAIQDELGYLPPEAVPIIARELNLSAAEVHGVISFYHHFRQAPPGRHVVQLCCAEACQARGGEALARHVREVLGCVFGETTADREFTLEPVSCLGHCACGPAVAIDGEPYARVSADEFDRLLQDKRGAQ